MKDFLVVLLPVLISVTGSIVVQLLINKSASDKDGVKRATRQQQLDDKLEVIEQKLQLHNEYAEKFATISQTIVLIQQDIEYLKAGLFDKKGA